MKENSAQGAAPADAVLLANQSSTSTPAVTQEDLKRADTRDRVQSARLKKRSPLLLWLLIGPGILTIIGDTQNSSSTALGGSGDISHWVIWHSAIF
mgnify:CR=1 FL=1